MMTREKLQALADGKLICATHFNYFAWVEKYEWYEWCKKPWDDYHKQGKDNDPALESD